jgi:hypothetical protein
MPTLRILWLRHASYQKSNISPIFRTQFQLSQLKSFLRTFSPTTTEMVDTIISVVLNLQHFSVL